MKNDQSRENKIGLLDRGIKQWNFDSDGQVCPGVLPMITSLLHLSWFFAKVAPRANVALSRTRNSLANGSIMSPSYSTQQCKVRLDEFNNQ